MDNPDNNFNYSFNTLLKSLADIPFAYYYERLKNLNELLQSYPCFYIESNIPFWRSIDYRIPKNREEFKDLYLKVSCNRHTGEGKDKHVLIELQGIKNMQDLYAVIAFQNLLNLREGREIIEPSVFYEFYINSKKDLDEAVKFLNNKAYHTPLTSLRLVDGEKSRYVSDAIDTLSVHYLFNKHENLEGYLKFLRYVVLETDYSAGKSYMINPPILDELIRNKLLVKALFPLNYERFLCVDVPVILAGTILSPVIAAAGMFDVLRNYSKNIKKAVLGSVATYGVLVATLLGASWITGNVTNKTQIYVPHKHVIVKVEEHQQPNLFKEFKEIHTQGIFSILNNLYEPHGKKKVRIELYYAKKSEDKEKEKCNISAYLQFPDKPKGNTLKLEVEDSCFKNPLELYDLLETLSKFVEQSKQK